MAARRKDAQRRHNAVHEPPATSAPRRTRNARERVFVTADDWQKRLAQLERMNAKEREEFDKARRLEISLTEDRMQALALIRSRFGPGDQGLHRAAQAGGCSFWTYRMWEDEARNVQPRDQSFKRTAVALGWKYGFHQ